MADGGAAPRDLRLPEWLADTLKREMVAMAWAVREDVSGERRPIGPCDLDAEGECLAVLLNGLATPQQLAPLAPKHFFSRFNSRVAAVLWASDERDPVRLADELARVGQLGPVAEQLMVLRDCQPIACGPALRRHALRLVELHERRRLIDTMRRLELELRLDTLTAADARARLLP